MTHVLALTSWPSTPALALGLAAAGALGLACDGDDGGMDSGSGVCQADFPCFGQTGRCVGDRQIRTMREVGCHEVCGPGPCSGRACVEGPIFDCRVDEVCMEVAAERGLRTAECVPCVPDDADAGSGNGDRSGRGGAGGSSGPPRCGTGSGCGDGLANPEYREECDDGNRTSGDGCSADCTDEEGWDCYASGMPCVTARGGNPECPEEACEQRSGCFETGSGVACGCPGDRSLATCEERAVWSLMFSDDVNRWHPTAISRDATTVVGFGSLLSAGAVAPTYAMRWNVALGTRSFSRAEARAVAVSADGSSALVMRRLDTIDEAWLWTSKAETRLQLPKQSSVRDISADGSVIVGDMPTPGSVISHAFRWTQKDAAVDLGELVALDCGRVPCQHGSQAYAVSGDGRIVVGATNGLAFRWTQADGMRALPQPSGLGPHVGSGRDPVITSAVDTSDDGRVIIGNARVSGVTFAVRWTDAEGGSVLGDRMEDLGTVRAVSADGSVCVGGNDLRGEAWVWTAEHGVRSLSQLLRDAGVETADWHFQVATGVSDDGAVVTGEGTYRRRPLGFVARLSARGGS